MEKVLYIKHADSTFIRIDQQILEKKYRVITFVINHRGSRLFFVFRLLSLLSFLIRNVWGSVALFTWFGDYHSALMVIVGKLFKKKTVIFIGGQEAVCYPELGKGIWRNRTRACIVAFALKKATFLIPNHFSLMHHRNFYYSEDGKPDGLHYYISKLSTPIFIIPNGIDTRTYFRDNSIIKNSRRILTVGTTKTVGDFINKGFDLFVEMARRNTDLDFTLIGINSDLATLVEKEYGVSKILNLEIIYSYCPTEILFYNYNRAKVFVQASITEGMPNTIGEAMLCECIPVGSNVNGIPDAIGNTGVIVLHRNIQELEDAVRQALLMNTGYKARERVIEQYSILNRQNKLLDLCDKMIG